MKLGAHMSAAGGLHKAYQRGREAGCETMLIFTKSNRQWKAKPLTDKDIQDFKEATAEYNDVQPVVVHASYLINTGSSAEDLWEKSYQGLKVEVERCEALEIPYLTFHPGAHVGEGEEVGLANIARALQRLLAETAGFKTIVCLETMAGTGTTLGYKFEHLAYLLGEGQAKGGNGRLGVCFDTCHVLAAGYDIRTPESYEAIMTEFEGVVGLNQIKCFHFNDSKYDLGERKDRHTHIGEGYVGSQGFANFVNDPRWADHPTHLETPKTEEDDEGNEIDMDIENLRRLRDLII
jgi:deoxyribonuclease-4